MARLKYIIIVLIGLAFVLGFTTGVFAQASGCYQYTTQATCILQSCNWRTDSWGSWCEEYNCWSLNNQSACSSTIVPGKNCTWQSGGTTYTCDEINCWIFQGTNQTACENNTAGKSCQWSSSCYSTGGSPGTDCWSITQESVCKNTTGCGWGQCWDKGCWYWNDVSSCNAAKDWNGNNCTWDSGGSYCKERHCWDYYNQSACNNAQGINCFWQNNYCQEMNCWTWDYTNAATCVNNTANLSCSWSGTWCTEQSCWNHNSQAACQQSGQCTWRAWSSSGWCEEINCWSWDSMNGGNRSRCLANATIYGLNCAWQNMPGGTEGVDGWCYMNMTGITCSNLTTEYDCMQSYYCFWDYYSSTCNNPGSYQFNNTVFNDWNPGCYIFDLNETACNATIGCTWSSGCTTTNADIQQNGINCTSINNSQLCTNIPVLSTCCSWEAGSCIKNQYSTSCWDQMQTPPEGASFCEDYNAYSNDQLCRQIANYPWFMPCKWDNSTNRCGFKSSQVFGNGTDTLILLDNKKSCESAGGKWIIENYCEGNISVPSGRCEYKFDDETNCDKACFACELYTGSAASVGAGKVINATNARDACVSSTLGYCEFDADTSAPNDIGYCKVKDQFKKGIAEDCNADCGTCTFMGDPLNNDTTKRPSSFCAASNANSANGGCKWINDNTTTTSGYCVKKGEKTCEDACDKCYTQSDCNFVGRTSVTNQSGSCMWEGTSDDGSCAYNMGEDVEICWDGIDNNNNALIDCGDSGCYADPFCGFVEGTCTGWTTNSTCTSNSCEWVNDTWNPTGWCDFPGSQCWRYDNNESTCTGIKRVVHETLNILTARLSGNNINESRTFTLSNIGGGWVISSVVIMNSTGRTLPAGNYTVDYTARTITFRNTTFNINNITNNITLVNYSYYESIAKSNCKWNNGTGTGWCEQDWSVGQFCMNLNRTTCGTGSYANCTWTNDTWCQGSGNSTQWCNDFGGWCNHVNFAPANCWQYQSSPSLCNNQTRCSWHTDQWSQPHCETNYTVNCWNNYNASSCTSAGCWWDSQQGWSSCRNPIEQCWSSWNQSACQALPSICYWTQWNSCSPLCFNETQSQSLASCNAVTGCYWVEQMGWCEEDYTGSCSNETNSNNQTKCNQAQGCRWNDPGWCDPKGGGFASAGQGSNCYKYDGNQSLCTNQSIINISCGWTSNVQPFCDVDWSADCWQYTEASSCSSNGCWWNQDQWGGGWCTNLADQCWSNQSLQSWSNPTGWEGNCTANQYCRVSQWNSCEPSCFGNATQATCLAGAGCKWKTGWCNPAGMNQMFTGMESGAPVMLGWDICDGTETTQASADLCGFGMKDMVDSYGFGAGVRNFNNASVCRSEQIQPGIVGSGNETIGFFVYIDTDGSTSGSCALSDNSSATGYEFRFRYYGKWNVTTASVDETFNAYKCENADWTSTDIKLSTWKMKMCSEIGGPMIAVLKSELARFPTLYDSTKDLRVYVTTFGNSGNASYPLDTAGPGWTTPGSIDFSVTDAFSKGADMAKFEDMMKKGFVQYEDCFNIIDDDADGNADCNDWDCEYSPKCTSTGVNAAGYNDTRAPQVTGVKIEPYTDAALIMYDTNKPTNGTVEFYYNNSQCSTINRTIYDIGIRSSSVRDYKVWHTGEIYNDSGIASLNYTLRNNTMYFYRLKVCDSGGKCAISKCTNFTTSSTDRCGYCSFVTRIKAPSDWLVSYDVNQDGTYEHVQGQVCGPNSGMATNYTAGRRVDIKLNNSDDSSAFWFFNATLTRTGLNDKVRTISDAGSLRNGTTTTSSGTTIGYAGMISETRDKIINNLHPEACRIKIPGTGTCNSLWHCADNLSNCVDRSTDTGVSLVTTGSNYCTWNIPCEFSVWAGGQPGTPSGDDGSSSGGGGGGGGGGSGKITYTVNDEEFEAGYTKSLGKGDRFKLNVSGELHYVTVDKLTSTTTGINVSSSVQQATLSIGEMKKFDLDSDYYYDLSVKLNSINITSSKANMTIKKVHESYAQPVPTPVPEPVPEPEQQPVPPSPTSTGRTATQPSGTFSNPFAETPVGAIGIVVVIIMIVVLGYLYYHGHHHVERARKFVLRK